MNLDGVGELLPDTVASRPTKVDGLRRRMKASQSAAEAQAADSEVIRQLKKLDFHPKSDKAASTRAKSGGVVTILSVALMLLLFVSETRDYLRSERQHTLHVDVRADQRRLPVFVDVSFYQIPCFALSLDVLDADGEQMADTAHSIKRTRIDGHGNVIGHLSQDVLGSAAVLGPKWRPPPGYCGACYVTTGSDAPQSQQHDASLAQLVVRDAPRKCCNSCFDLKREFLAAGLDIQQAEQSEQCLRERDAVAPERLEGCRIQGFFEIRRTKGNFHVAAGQSQSAAHSHHRHHFHRVSKEDVAGFNASHFIHHMQFGQPIDGVPPPPLDGLNFITDSLIQAKYIINIVPIEYHWPGGHVSESFQFASTYHALPIDLNQEHYPLPGCFFNFDFSELRIRYEEMPKSFSQYVLRLCSSVGGVFVSIGLLYQFLSEIPARLFKNRSASFR